MRKRLLCKSKCTRTHHTPRAARARASATPPRRVAQACGSVHTLDLRVDGVLGQALPLPLRVLLPPLLLAGGWKAHRHAGRIALPLSLDLRPLGLQRRPGERVGQADRRAKSRGRRVGRQRWRQVNARPTAAAAAARGRRQDLRPRTNSPLSSAAAAPAFWLGGCSGVPWRHQPSTPAATPAGRR